MHCWMLRASETLKIRLLGEQLLRLAGGMSQDVPNTICCILHALFADLCMSYVQTYECVMCIAVQTGSLRFAGLALLALRPYSARSES